MSFLFIIYAAMKLAVNKHEDTELAEFSGDDAMGSLAQALLGVSTALEYAEEGNIKSVKDGITDPVRANATDESKGYRDLLEEYVDTIADQYQQIQAHEPMDIDE